jgi:hypothetical protein
MKRHLHSFRGKKILLLVAVYRHIYYTQVAVYSKYALQWLCIVNMLGCVVNMLGH